jgi:ERCC4-related helicase
MRSVTHKMAEALFPKDQDQPTPIYSYKVRAHLRTEMKHALDWALTEDTANTIHTLFKNAYPLNYLPEIKFRRTATAQIINQPWQTYLAAPVSKTIMADWIDSNLAQESAQTPYRDAKEIALLAHLKTLPANAKVLINCEEIYEAKLLATRLNSAGISAGWYAGKSVPKREGTAENLKKFRAGELQVLCATSAADTGHDIADVSEVIRIKPLTSPIKNSQSAGRSGRQAGLTGRYRTLINRDSNPSFSEEQQYLIGLHRIRAMRKAAQRRVID